MTPDDNGITRHDLVFAEQLGELKARVGAIETLLLNHTVDEQKRQQQIDQKLQAIHDQLVVGRTLRRFMALSVSAIAATAAGVWAFVEWAQEHLRL